MAITNILNTLLPTFAFDSVAVFTQDFTQIFRNARPIKAVVKEQAKVMEHPVESGVTITDHRIILPIEIELSLILASADYQSVYSNIKQYYLNATLLTIQTRSGVYQNQLIASMPHEEDPTQYNVLTVALSLKEVIFVSAQYTTLPKKSGDSSTVKTGEQQAAPTPTPSAFRQIFNYAGSFF